MISGREAHKSLLPLSCPDIPGMEIAARFVPSAHVSGDLYNIFRLDEKTVGLYNLDVSGHGISAALFSVTISQRLTHLVHPHSLLKVRLDKPPFYRINPPEEVIRRLDQEDFLERHGHYLTMVYALFDITKGLLSFCRAGHNFPLLIRSVGTAEYIMGGGLPVGMHIRRKKRQSLQVRMVPGETFLLFSDGISEATPPDGEERYGLERIRRFFSDHHQEPLTRLFDRLIEEVRNFQGGRDFEDDVSLIGFRWRERR